MRFELNHIDYNGIDVFYRVSGMENDVSVIFIHGIAGDSRFFHNQLKYFGKYYRTIAVDLPGHGRSSFLAEQSIAIYNKSIEAILKKEKIDSYILVGHSMGGVICLENYLRHKNKVKGMILISTSPVLPVTNEQINAAINNFESFFSDMLHRTFHKKAGIFIIAAQRNITDEEKQSVILDLELCSQVNYEAELKKIEVPVLLIADKYDQMVPAALTADMKGKIRKSRLVIFYNGGHVPFFENSSEFNSSVEKFIKEIL